MRCTEFWRLQAALEAVAARAKCVLATLAKVGVRGSAADGTGLPGCDLDVDLVLTGPLPSWTDAQAQVAAVADAMSAPTIRLTNTHRRGFALVVDVPRAPPDTVAVTQVPVDVFVKWVDDETVMGFTPQGCPRAFGLLVHMPDKCSEVVTGLGLAVLAVKHHVKTRRPGIKSYHIGLLAKQLVSTRDRARDTRMLWALVVEAGLNGDFPPEWCLDYDSPPYAGHPEYLSDVML